MSVSRIIAILIIIIIQLLSRANSASEITIIVSDSDNKPVADIIVYMLPLDQQILKSSTSELVVYQSKKKFSPYISVLSKGMALSFINKDNITHQIYSTSSKNRFSFRIYSNTQKSIDPLLNTGKILMGCNIHDWMSGYLLVVDTPLYSKTDKYGLAVIDVTETGRYQLSVWHPQMMVDKQTISRTIDIKDSSSFQVQLAGKLADIPNQENPESFEFLNDY